MKKALLIIASLIAISCAMKSWQFNLPPRIMIYNVLSVLFLFFLSISFFVAPWKIKLRKELKVFIILQLFFLFVMVFSGLKVLFISSGQESFTQYFKLITLELFNALFFTALVIYLSQIKSDERKLILKYYGVGVILSCLYSVLYLTLYSSYNINIEDHIWASISYGGVQAEQDVQWTVMGVPRGFGFAGVGAAATYVVTAVPLLIINASVDKTVKNISLIIIAVIGLLATMSRTGIIAFGVSLIILITLERHRLRSLTGVMLLALVPLGYLAYMSWDLVSAIIQSRIGIDESRLDLYKGGIELFFKNPILGVGANNYPIVRFSLPSHFFHASNIHNSWLTILVELGIIGLVSKLAYFLYVIYIITKKKNIMSNAFIAALIGLFVGAIFNEVFGDFYFNFFVVIFFSSIILGDTDLYASKKKQKNIIFPR